MRIRTVIALAVLVCGLLMAGGGVRAMSSGGYAIDWDAIGGGGEPAGSANYAIRSTVGQAVAESSFSTNYRVRSGYWYPTIGITGDVNNDDHVNVLDMILIAQHWGETGSPGWIPEDVKEDGAINVLDMIIIGQHWTG